MERPERLVLVILGALFNRMAPVLWVIAVSKHDHGHPPHALHLDPHPRPASRPTQVKPHRTPPM